jgi:hypothetical protein
MMQTPDKKVQVGAGMSGLTAVLVGLLQAFTDVSIDPLAAVGFTGFATFVVQYFVPNP